MARLALDVVDIFRDHGPVWRGHVSLGQLGRCRTVALGG
jgi:hypothetical protein